MDRLNLYKYELFFGSQLAILFGTLLIPESIHDYYSTGAFFVNIVAGSLFIGYGESKHNPIIRVIVLALIAIIFLLANSFPSLAQIFNYSKFGILFVFHLVVTAKLINQIWNTVDVNKNVIFGLMSGYISLGFIGFFIFMGIEILHPGSYTGIEIGEFSNSMMTERLMYFSYITLMTIGYGDILPISQMAQKATLLVGLMGQFYLVIVTAIVIGKFISQGINKTEK